MLHQPTHPADLTSVGVLHGLSRKTVVRMHSALCSPFMVSIRALSYGSPTEPIEGLNSANATY